MPGEPEDRWIEGDAYERYMGRWSRRVAEQFIAWLAPAAGGRWLEVGSGTGALTSAIARLAEPSSITAIEPSAGFRSLAEEQLAAPNVHFLEGDAQRLPEGQYDFVVSGLVLNFLPDLDTALRGFRLATSPNGTLAAYVWDYADGMEFLRIFWDEAVALAPGAQALDEGQRFPICAPEALEEAFTRAGLADVDVAALVVETLFADFDDFWLPFTDGPGPAPGYVASLTFEQRAELRDALSRRLPRDSDGSIRLRARAWAVRGRNPTLD